MNVIINSVIFSQTSSEFKQYNYRSRKKFVLKRSVYSTRIDDTLSVSSNFQRSIIPTDALGIETTVKSAGWNDVYIQSGQNA